MQNLFHHAMSSLVLLHYQEILFLDVENDSYSILNMNPESFDIEGRNEAGKVSEWFLKLSESPLCFESDRRRVKEYADIENILNIFLENGDKPYSFQYQRKNSEEDADYRVIEIEMFPERNKEGQLLVFLYVRDITAEQVKSQQEIREALAYAESICEQNEDLIADMNKTYRLIHETLKSSMWRMDFDDEGIMTSVTWSDEFRRMMGYENEIDFPDILESWTERIYDEDKDYVLKEYFDTIDDYTGQKTFEVEYRFKLKNGDYHWFRAAGRLSRRYDGSPESYVGICVDITEKKISDSEFAQLKHDSLVDKLTGLYNRRAFDSALDKLNTSATTVTYSIIALDVNGLKTLNDSIGHFAGDNLLRAAATCINSFFGKEGKCYRTGGDEFVIITQQNIEDIESYKNSFKECVENYSDENIDHLTISIGVVRVKDHPFVPISELLKLADDRMYKDKDDFYKKTGLKRR